MSPCFGPLGRLCFVVVAFSGYRHLHFGTISKKFPLDLTSSTRAKTPLDSDAAQIKNLYLVRIGILYLISETSQ